MRYLIIGGGIAGTTAAEELRKIDPRASIVLLSEERHRLYSRVLLPHYIKGKIKRERVFLKREAWYDEIGIEWRPGMTATKLDVRNKFVVTDDGREHEYNKLLIAAGGEVKTYIEDRRGVSYLRTLDDADHLLQLLSEFSDLRPPTSDLRLGIIGGGFIALEYINIFGDRGLPADLFLRNDHFFGQILDQESSDLIKERAESHGIIIHPNAPDVNLSAFKLVGVGIGIEPDLSWIEASGIKVCAGLVTNEYLETNVPDVYAAGDAAEFYDVTVGRQRIVGNWMNAQAQGRVVARTMTSERTKFELVSSYSTNCRGMEVIFVGDVDREAAEKVVVEGSKAEGGVVQLFIRQGRVVGATLVNRNQDRAEVTARIKEQVKFP